MPVAQFGGVLAGLMDLIPSYIDETGELLQRLNRKGGPLDRPFEL